MLSVTGEMYKDDFSDEDNKRNQDLFEEHQQRLEGEVGKEALGY